MEMLRSLPRHPEPASAVGAGDFREYPVSRGSDRRFAVRVKTGMTDLDVKQAPFGKFRWISK